MSSYYVSGHLFFIIDFINTPHSKWLKGTYDAYRHMSARSKGHIVIYLSGKQGKYVERSSAIDKVSIVDLKNIKPY